MSMSDAKGPNIYQASVIWGHWVNSFMHITITSLALSVIWKSEHGPHFTDEVFEAFGEIYSNGEVLT